MTKFQIDSFVFNLEWPMSLCFTLSQVSILKVNRVWFRLRWVNFHKLKNIKYNCCSRGESQIDKRIRVEGLTRGRHKWKFSRYPKFFFLAGTRCPSVPKVFFSGRYPVPIGTQIFFWLVLGLTVFLPISFLELLVFNLGVSLFEISRVNSFKKREI